MSILRPIPYFEKNLGQLPIDIKYKMKVNDYITFFKEDKLIVNLPSNLEHTRNVFYMKLENKNNDVDIKGQENQIGKVNYLIGKDESKWIKNIPTYSKIKYEEIYENIDLYYYVNNMNLEYDFVLYKGANPKDICISFEGVDNIEMNEKKDIVLTIGDVKAILLKPSVYQIIDNIKLNIDCEYILDESNNINFLVNEYQDEYELVLDPVLKLDYSTYIGDKNNEIATAIALDEAGNAYITGWAENYYPTTEGSYQTIPGGNNDAFVTKLSVDGSYLIYSTYIGGDEYDTGNAIAVDDIGFVYITGCTQGNYPVTSSAYQVNYAGGEFDIFVSKLSRDGSSLIYSTYLGGNEMDVGTGICVDNKGYAYIVGYTMGDYPTTEGSYQASYGGGDYDVLVSKLNQDGSNLVYSTYIGGDGREYGNAIAIDNEGYVYITGETTGNYPTTDGTYQIDFGGFYDVFVSKLNQDGSDLIYSTYIGGGSRDTGYGIAVDNLGNAYITGETESINYPTTQGAYQAKYSGNYDAFVSKLSRDGRNLIYSTYVGGSDDDSSYGIKVDGNGCAYITGITGSYDFPITDGAYQNDYGNIFLSKLNVDGSLLVYSTYLGTEDKENVYGIEVDSDGGAFITGYMGQNKDVFVFKIASVAYNLSWNYSPSKVKLFDKVSVNLRINNISSTSVDMYVKNFTIDSAVTFVPGSLSIQNIKQSTNTIPNQIYLPNIPAKEIAEISFDLKYKNEQYPEKISIMIEVEAYYNKEGNLVLADNTSKVFYINTTIGPNYIPGCNELYNLEINNKLQTTVGGIPIIYYKSGNSYMYIEPKGSKYEYKVLEVKDNIVEYPINI